MSTETAIQGAAIFHQEDDGEFITSFLMSDVLPNTVLRRCVITFNDELRSLQQRFGIAATAAFLRSNPLDKSHAVLQSWDGCRVQILKDKPSIRLSGLLHKRPYRLVVWGNRSGSNIRVYSGFATRPLVGATGIEPVTPTV